MTLRPNHYLRTPNGWARVVRIDPLKGPVCEQRAPLDDRDIPGAGRCSAWEFLAACGAAPRSPITRAGDPPPRSV